MDCNDLEVDFGFFIMLDPFMILSKQSGVLLIHFRWKIQISGDAERKTRQDNIGVRIS